MMKTLCTRRAFSVPANKVSVLLVIGFTVLGPPPTEKGGGSVRQTFGRNTNYLLNISPNTNGNIDAVDHEAYRGLGAWIGATFGEANLVGKAGPVALGSNESVVLNYLARAPRYVALLEDQAAGQHIWGWELHAHPRGGVGWTLLARGESIGHKRLVAVDEAHGGRAVEALRLTVTLTATPEKATVRALAAYG